MKTLILVRHAKSSWEQDVIDHERPLLARGIQDAILVSKQLNKNCPEMDLTLCSDALRTKCTLDIFTSHLQVAPGPIQFRHDLYDFSGENLTQVIKSCKDSVNTLMVFGHNHALTAFVNTYGSLPIDNVPTSGVTIIEFETNKWQSIALGKTVKTIFPKDLR